MTNKPNSTIETDYTIPLAELYENFSNNATTVKFVESEIKKVRVKFAMWGLFMTTLTTLIYTLVMLNPLDRPIGEWYARSGSLYTILPLLAEVLFLNSIKDIVTPSTHKLSCEIYIERKYKRAVNFSVAVTIFTTVMGTVVWGYGDLLFVGY